jgi:hypothetical protein
MVAHFFLIAFVLFFANPIVAQNQCLVGKSINFAPAACNFSAGYECIHAFLYTQAKPGVYLPGYTEIFDCDLRSTYDALAASGVMTNVSSCNSSDLCITGPTNPLPTTGCETIDDQDTCTNTSKCYWCGNSIVGNGICKSFAGWPYPCYALYTLAMPANVCGYIGCNVTEPYTTPNETMLTKDFLYNFGMPNPGFVPFKGNFSVLTALDISGRQFHVMNITQYTTRGFCGTDNDLQDWCGTDNSAWPNTFKYCLATDKWPQPDVWGWISNTTFTKNGITPFFPAICACPIAGRAYYIPQASTGADFYFGPDCNAEWAWLAFAILILILAFLVLLFVLYDTYVLAAIYFTSENKKKANSIGSQTLWAKICMILYFIVSITCLFLFITPNPNSTAKACRVITRLLAIGFCIYSFCISVFTFVDILLGCKVFGNFKKFQVFLKVFRVVYFAYNTILLFAILVIASAYDYYLQVIQDFRIDSLTEFLTSLTHVQNLGQATVIMLILTQFIMVIVTGVLLFFIAYILYTRSSNIQGQKYVKHLFVRLVCLIVGVIISIPNLAFFILVGWNVAWLTAGARASPFPTDYRTMVEFKWVGLIEFLTEILWVAANAFAMRTLVNNSLLYKQIKKWFSGSGSGSFDSMSTQTGSASKTSKSSRATDSKV